MLPEKIKKFVLDILFPIDCIGCGSEGQWICLKCQDNLAYQKDQICIGCGRASKGGLVCTRCGKKWSLDRTLLVFNYDDKVLQKAIKALKYKYAHDIASELGQMLLKFYESKKFAKKNIVFIPVPLHKKRFRQRGFNQAELLSRAFSSRYKVDSTLLIRKKYTKAQAKLGEEARKENIKQAFACLKSDEVKNKIVVLVDDVITTGSTLNECAKILKDAGARKVWGLALAKG